jgi:hypothetical protein
MKLGGSAGRAEGEIKKVGMYAIYMTENGKVKKKSCAKQNGPKKRERMIHSAEQL